MNTAPTVTGDSPVPEVLREALEDLDVTESLRTLGEVAAWAETNLRFTMPCSPDGTHHNVLVDPRTLTVTPDPNDPEVATAHFLWSMAYDAPTPCEEADTVLGNWASSTVPHMFGPTNPAKVRAVRTVGRSVQFLYAGVCPRVYREWVLLGVDPSTVISLRQVARRYGRRLSDLEEGLILGISTLRASDRAAYQADMMGERLVRTLTSQLRDAEQNTRFRDARKQEMKARRKQTRKRSEGRSTPRPEDTARRPVRSFAATRANAS